MIDLMSSLSSTTTARTTFTGIVSDMMRRPELEPFAPYRRTRPPRPRRIGSLPWDRVVARDGRP
jgi:hypothetical protein